MTRACLGCLTLALLLLPLGGASGQVTVYHDRAAFTAALSNPPTIDTFDTYAPGDIGPGDTRGDFAYSFDPLVTQPAIVPDGAGGQALGGSPFGVFVGGDAVTLTAGAGSSLSAFGADLFYAPSFDVIPADTYRLAVADGSAAGDFAGNPDSLDPNGGSFFLGLIAAPGSAFTGVRLLSVQTDPDFLVPAYQGDNLIYAGAAAPPSVPEPNALALLLAASPAILVIRPRRRHA